MTSWSFYPYNRAFGDQRGIQNLCFYRFQICVATGPINDGMKLGRKRRDENQLHAAVVELVALDNAQIKYSTVQNWYPGDKQGRGGIYNFVTKRGKCLGVNSRISWTQVETGSAMTWKYPSCILQGDNSVGEFYSVALTNNYQQADTASLLFKFHLCVHSHSVRDRERKQRRTKRAEVASLSWLRGYAASLPSAALLR